MRKIILAAIAILSTASFAQGIGIDSSKYWAYTTGPGGVVAISRMPCNIKKHAKLGWWLAKYYRGEGDLGLDACWKNGVKPYFGAVTVCIISSEIKNEFSYCAPSLKEEFMETKSLPKRPSFY